MVEKDTLGYVLRGKSGWGTEDGEEIGWFVGYVEVKDNICYFATCVQTKSEYIENKETEKMFINSRREITYIILKDTGVIPD